MHQILKTVLAVIAGLLVGSIVNMGLVTMGGSVIPPPAGVDVTDMESLKSSMHLLETRHFLFPFLAHALGTLVGAWIAARLSGKFQLPIALGIAGFFSIGGLVNAFMLPAPGWFIAVDLLFAYFPMGWLAARLQPAAKTES